MPPRLIDPSWTQEQTLRAIEGLQEFVSKTERIDRTYAITDSLKTINREMHGGDEKFFTLPDSREMAAQYLVLLHENDTEKYIDSDYATAALRYSSRGK